MKITRENYEAYFLDYLEGNLPDELVDDFIEFLQHNPDLKEELQLTELVKLKPVDVIYESKERLLRDKYDNEDTFNFTAVALMEGDLDEKEKSEFITWLEKHPQKQKEVFVFENTKLVPDQNIVYSSKSRLFRYPVSKTIFLWTTRVAVVLVLGFFVWRMSSYLNPVQQEFNSKITVEATPENKKENSESNIPPVKAEKKQDNDPEKEIIKPQEKKIDNKSQPSKSLRESTTGRMNHEQLAEVRMPAEVPQRMESRYIELAFVESLHPHLVPVRKVLPDISVPIGEERLLGQVIREKTGVGNLSLNKVTQAGLNLVATITGEKFSYETNSEGQITELAFDSRLLAFSIPTRNE